MRFKTELLQKYVDRQIDHRAFTMICVSLMIPPRELKIILDENFEDVEKRYDIIIANITRICFALKKPIEDVFEQVDFGVSFVL